MHPNPRVETHLFSNNAKSLDIDRLHLKIAWGGRADRGRGIRNWPRALGLQANFLNAVVKIRNPRGLVKVSGFLIHKIGCTKRLIASYFKVVLSESADAIPER